MLKYIQKIPGSTRLTAVIAMFCLLALILHLLHLQHFVNICKTANKELYITTDSGFYQNVANHLLGKGYAQPTYRERPFYPCLLILCDSLGEDKSTVLRLVSFLNVLAVAAIGYLAYLFTNRIRGTIIACSLYIFYPNTYQYGVVIETDALHAFLALCAIACTAGWTIKDHKPCGWGAMIFWLLTLLTRPTFFLVVFLLPVILWRPMRNGRRIFAAMIFMAALFAPLFSTLLHYNQYGLFAPSIHAPEILYRSVLPQMKALIANDENPVPLSSIYNYERDVAAFQNPAFSDYYAYRGETTNMRDSYRVIMNESKRFILDHPVYFLRSTFWGLQQQILPFFPMHYFPRKTGSNIDQIEWVQRLFRALHYASVILGWCGLLLLARKGRCDWAAFIFGIIGIVIGPTSLIWWFGDRFRLPVDLLLLSIIPLAMLHKSPWIILASIFVLAYLPMRIIGLPESYFHFTAGGLLALGTVLLLKYEPVSKFRCRSTSAMPS